MKHQERQQRCEVIMRIMPIEEKKVRWHQPQVIWRNDFPRWLAEENIYRFQLIAAHFRVRYPRQHVTIHHRYYLATGENISLFHQLNGAKSQLSKYRNKLDRYVRSWQPTLMVQDITEDPSYQLAKEKIAAQEFKVRTLQNQFEKSKS